VHDSGVLAIGEKHPGQQISPKLHPLPHDVIYHDEAERLSPFIKEACVNSGYSIELICELGHPGTSPLGSSGHVKGEVVRLKFREDHLGAEHSGLVRELVSADEEPPFNLLPRA
jgi:hypothetical protein